MSIRFQPMCAIQAKPEQIDWLWWPYLASGKLAILDGDPGTGKSMISIDIAARLSRGADWPDGSPGPGTRKTLILNAEDDPADTLAPRLIAAGADLNQIYLAGPTDDQGPLKFSRELAEITRLVGDQHIGLVVIDPLSAFVDADLSLGQSAQRYAIGPLALLAARAGVAVLVIRHLTKRLNDSAIRRGLGSMSIMGLARTGMIVGRHPHDPTISLLSVTKTNLTAAPDPLAFRMKSHEQSVVVDWLGFTAGTADDAVRTPERAEPPDVVRATLWLLDALAQGPRPAAELLAAAKADGIKERTLDRAKRSLGIRSEYTHQPNGLRAWLWRPPENKPKTILDRSAFEIGSHRG